MCPPNRITAILHGLRGITADTALRLARYFGGEPRFWLNLQVNYELAVAARNHPDYLKIKPCLPEKETTRKSRAVSSKKA